ncbi:hypothetical protein N7468_005570 [Penicillium chermesinum]|uniref:Uncharacterized protein n=1 Tax=Penicillium chermesinum TaxID=63820 RepID=A0A9W9TPT7_9EURO|nr:uncharacterized protein N7468_005570 [Penicillium chermesinum]KAJ5232614.1 hypothetical protein N7468_005570 [Penicillium chermesinum]KAJ6172272.1 hypothetical protein N7470_001339 [Penicillium chermesinum]
MQEGEEVGSLGKRYEEEKKERRQRASIYSPLLPPFKDPWDTNCYLQDHRKVRNVTGSIRCEQFLTTVQFGKEAAGVRATEGVLAAGIRRYFGEVALGIGTIILTKVILRRENDVWHGNPEGIR